jgi:hypothetical protein
MWSGGVVPNVATQAVQIDASNATVDSVVTLDQDVTVRSVTIDPGDTLNIPTGRTLSLSAPLGVGGIVSHSGNFEANNTTGNPTATLIAIAGGEFRYNAGTVKPNGSISLTSGGKLLMSPGRDKVLKMGNLAISSTSIVDIADNILILTNANAGTATGSDYNGIQGEVQRAYNFSGWDEPGLRTSMPDAGPTVGKASIGVATGEQVAYLAPDETGVWAGETISGTTVIAMYTWAGDVDLNGYVDAVDYGTIDQWIQFPGTTGYTNGDLNYDGVIDAVDYGIIDNGIQLQGAPMLIPGSPAAAATAAGSIAAVPEPAGMFSVAAAAALMLSRRRRRRRATASA